MCESQEFDLDNFSSTKFHTEVAQCIMSINHYELHVSTDLQNFLGHRLKRFIGIASDIS